MRTINIVFTDSGDEDEMDDHSIDIEMKDEPGSHAEKCDFEDLRLKICDAVRECLKDHPEIKDFTWCH